MSKDFEPCCGRPEYCMSTDACVTRSSFRRVAAQAQINAVTHGVTPAKFDGHCSPPPKPRTRTYTAGDTGETVALACCGNLSTCESDAPCTNRDKYQAFWNEDNEQAAQSVAEVDPNGMAANKPGAKLDAGKVRVGLVMSGFARALWAVAEIGTFGANKYTDNGWMEVPNGINRYNDAKWRHILKDAMGEQEDPESNKRHAAHEAWNALARLDLILREEEKKVEHL